MRWLIPGDFLIVAQRDVGKPERGQIRIAANDERLVRVAKECSAEIRNRIDADVTRQLTGRIGVEMVRDGEQVGIVSLEFGQRDGSAGEDLLRAAIVADAAVNQ